MPKTLEGLRFHSLAGAAADQLRRAVIEGRLQPGERLIEQKMAAALGTSQPTVREALKELEYQGFVRKIANRGTYVTQLSREDLQKISEVRLELEGLAIERAAENMTDEVRRKLRRLVEEMGAAAKKGDRLRFHEADLEFHRLIWELTNNEYLQAALERLLFSLFAFVLVRQEPEEFLAAVEQHRQILAGLSAADPAEARRVFLKSTLDYWCEHHHVERDSKTGKGRAGD